MKDLAKIYLRLLKASLPDSALSAEELEATAARAAKSWAFRIGGYTKQLKDVIGDAIYPAKSSDLVVIKNIAFSSTCAHHLLPFLGTCHIAYVPNKKLLGLSKFSRVVDMLARRLRLQEYLTQEIAEAIQTVTEAKGVGVILTARHACVTVRGVEKRESSVTSYARLGELNSDNYWQQFVAEVRC